MKLFKLHKPCLILGSPDPDLTSALLATYAVHFKQVEGQFRGERESAFVIPADRSLAALHVAAATGQEYILHLDEYRKASLVDVAAGIVDAPFGQWQSVSKPNEGEDFTYDPMTSTYYVVR